MGRSPLAVEHCTMVERGHGYDPAEVNGFRSRLMNFRFFRTWKLVAALVVLGLVATCFYLRFVGWSHPFAKYIGAYKYPVATLGEYVRYRADPKRFYDGNSAASLSFDCERIRDELVKLTQSIVSPELSTTTETIVWREGRTLHLTDRSVAGSEAFAAWKNQIVKVATAQHPREAGHYGTLLQALFASVAIHGSNPGEDFSVETKRGGDLDICG
jgi:hypothetical protein